MIKILQEVAGMADNKNWFIKSSNYDTLQRDIAHGERIAHHALDNWGMDMSKELVEALQALEQASKAVLKQMEADKHE